MYGTKLIFDTIIVCNLRSKKIHHSFYFRWTILSYLQFTLNIHMHQGNGFLGNDESGFHSNQSLQVLSKTLISGTELFGTSLIKLKALCTVKC